MMSPVPFESVTSEVAVTSRSPSPGVATSAYVPRRAGFGANVEPGNRAGRPLVVDTVRGHRWGIVAWIVGGAVGMIVMGAALASERDRFPGGAKALAASVMPGAEAMRLLRWPAERLDTFGGYLTYHNVTVFLLALCVYGAVQGAHAVRGVEATGMSAELLATGRSPIVRWSRPRCQDVRVGHREPRVAPVPALGALGSEHAGHGRVARRDD
jgi:hypothetical protein